MSKLEYTHLIDDVLTDATSVILSDVGETAADTAVRELWEETGLRGNVTRFLGIFDSHRWSKPESVTIVDHTCCTGWKM